MKKLIIILSIFLISNNFVFGQIKEIQFNINNNDRINKIEFDTISNIFIINYKIENVSKSKKISFFKNFNSTAATINIEYLKSNLIFTIRYSPKYNNFDKISFKYIENSDDWYLENVLTHRFNSLDKSLMTKECSMRVCLKNRISLSIDNFEKVQKFYESHKMKNCREFSEE